MTILNEFSSLSAIPSELMQLSLVNVVQEGDSIRTAFKIATFLPQPLWLLLIFFPSSSFTKYIMGPLSSILLFSLVHFFIVVSSLLQSEGTAPMAEFANVFDLSGDSLGGMMTMMKYPNFVSEEWSHVLTWDLFVGRWIWLDGLKRNIFTPHSILLTNLIGPPGFLLHALTCLIQGKHLPNEMSDFTDLSNQDNLSTSDRNIENNNMNSKLKNVPTKRADDVIKEFIVNAYENEQNVENFISSLADNIIWEDLSEKDSTIGLINAKTKALERLKSIPNGSSLIIDNIADGISSAGYTWYYAQDGVKGKGLRGTTFVSLNNKGKVDYIQEVSEPLYKPGTLKIDIYNIQNLN